MNIAATIRALYPDLTHLIDFRVEDHGDGPEIVMWNASYPEPTEEDLKAGWLSVAKAAKVEEFEERAKTLAGDIWLDALVELADASARPTGPPAQMPNVTQLKDIRSRLSRARSAAQAVDPSKHNGDPLKAAKAVQDLVWEDL